MFDKSPKPFKSSIFFFPTAGLIAYIITRNKKFALAVALGAFLHLLQDMHDDVPFLYPLKDYAFFDACKQIEIVFTRFVIVTELIGGSLFIFVFRFSKRFIEFRRVLWNAINKILKG